MSLSSAVKRSQILEKSIKLNRISFFSTKVAEGSIYAESWVKSEQLIDLVVLRSGLHISCFDCLTGNEQGPSD